MRQLYPRRHDRYRSGVVAGSGNASGTGIGGGAAHGCGIPTSVGPLAVPARAVGRALGSGGDGRGHGSACVAYVGAGHLPMEWGV